MSWGKSRVNRLFSRNTKSIGKDENCVCVCVWGGVLVNLTSNFRFFRGVSDVDCVDVEASAMLAEGSDSRLLTFAFLLGQTQSPFANKSLVACNVKPSVIRFCKVLILTLQRKPRSNVRFVSIPPCPCEVPNVFANLDR